MLGLPDVVTGCLFDMDGVLTQTATVHAAAWQQTFDEFLRDWADRHDQPYLPFDPVADYDRYVDGRSRLDGVRTFLAARHIDLPEGTPDDPPGTWTVHGLGNRKNNLVLEKLAEGGVRVYEGSVRYVRAVRAAGMSAAVVTASANAAQVLSAAGIEDLFDARIDGVVSQERGLRGKPAPDLYLAGAEALGIGPDRAAVFEDALAGVRAGRAGDFACVVGVDRVGQAEELRRSGAELVVKDLAELLDAR